MNEQQLQDQLARFGGGSASTTITPATIALVLMAILLIFSLPKKYAIVPFILVTILVPYSQVILIAGLHFNVYRVMLPFAWVRAIISFRQAGTGKFQLMGVDKALILWALTDAICFTLLWGSWEAFVNRLGSLYNVFGLYFLLRILIRNREDVNRLIRILAIVCTLLAVFMVREQMTGENIFSLFGGVPEFTRIRDGALRSQGAFAHPIVAGTVGATLLPLFVGLWWREIKSKAIAVLGIVSTLAMVWTSNSATPLLSCAAGVAALGLWPFRRSLWLFRWGIVIALAGLNMVMKAPVWALLGRITVVGGNSSWHRFELVNQAIVHFSDWWLFGERNPSSWGYLMGDVSNGYVIAALNGGLLALIFFLGIFWQAFRTLGVARKAVEKEPTLAFMLWACGAALFTTAVSYFGIWYFDQSVLVWYALLAVICAVSSVALIPLPESEIVPIAPLHALGWPVTSPLRMVGPGTTAQPNTAMFPGGNKRRE